MRGQVLAACSPRRGGRPKWLRCSRGRWVRLGGDQTRGGRRRHSSTGISAAVQRATREQTTSGPGPRSLINGSMSRSCSSNRRTFVPRVAHRRIAHAHSPRSGIGHSTASRLGDVLSLVDHAQNRLISELILWRLSRQFMTLICEAGVGRARHSAEDRRDDQERRVRTTTARRVLVVEDLGCAASGVIVTRLWKLGLHR
jgi:hypothetical protein